MTPEQQISQQMNNEFEKFRDTLYNGVIKVPENLIELFKKGVVHLAPQFHQVNFTKIKHLITQQPNKLTNGEITEVVKIVVNTPFDVLYGKLELAKGVDEQIRLEKFILCYNNHVSEFQKKMRMKQTTLQSLTNGTRGENNGMRLVN